MNEQTLGNPKYDEEKAKVIDKIFMTKTEQIRDKVNQYWFEHDGTHFYKDELLDFVKGLLAEQREEIVEEVEKLRMEVPQEGSQARELLCNTVLDTVLSILSKSESKICL